MDISSVTNSMGTQYEAKNTATKKEGLATDPDTRNLGVIVEVSKDSELAAKMADALSGRSRTYDTTTRRVIYGDNVSADATKQITDTYSRQAEDKISRVNGMMDALKTKMGEVKQNLYQEIQEKGNNGAYDRYQQAVDKTENVETKTTRKAAADELAYLSDNFKDYSFVSVNYSQGMRYGTSTTTNVAISPQFLEKMANDPELEAEYVKEIGNMRELDEQFIQGQAARGWKVVAQGWAIDKDGGISSWAITTKDPKAKSFLQKMSEKSDEIRQKQLEKAKEEKRVHKKEDVQRKGIDLRL